MPALVTNERGHREWLYLLQRFGESRLLSAIQELPGNRKHYPLNVARTLGIQLPQLADLPKLDKEPRTRRQVELGLRNILGLLASLGKYQNCKSDEAK